MKKYGLLVLGSAVRAWEWASLITGLVFLVVAYFALGQLAHAPLPPESRPTMREQAQMGRRLGRTLQYGCLGLGAILVLGTVVKRGIR